MIVFCLLGLCVLITISNRLEGNGAAALVSKRREPKDSMLQNKKHHLQEKHLRLLLILPVPVHFWAAGGSRGQVDEEGDS